MFCNPAETSNFIDRISGEPAAEGGRVIALAVIIQAGFLIEILGGEPEVEIVHHRAGGDNGVPEGIVFAMGHDVSVGAHDRTLGGARPRVVWVGLAGDVEGLGALVMPQKKWAVINKNVKMSDKNGRVITCNGPLEVDYEERKAILKNNVKIIDTEGTMYADEMIAYFDSDKRQIEKIEWLGNVKAVY